MILCVIFLAKNIIMRKKIMTSVHDACEMSYKNGGMAACNEVKKYLLDCLDEWDKLGDRKWELPNIQVYNHVRKCLDDLEKLEAKFF